MGETFDDLSTAHTLFMSGLEQCPNFPAADEIIALLSQVGSDLREIDKSLLAMTMDASPADDVERDLLADMGQEVIAWATRQWELGIIEPSGGKLNGAEHIDRYIRADWGAGWSTAQVRPWKEGQPYTRNGQYLWCGAFAAAAWGSVSHPLNAEARREHLPSTSRIFPWGWDKEKRSANARRVPLDKLRAGDILVVGNLKRKRNPSRWCGSHITLVERVEGATIHTIEGNATGLLPSGSRGEGVVRCERPLRYTDGYQGYYALFAYRPLLSDLVSSPTT